VKKIFALFTLFVLINSALYAVPPEYKYMYSVSDGLDKLTASSVMQKQAKFIRWEKGKLLYKDVFSPGSSWNKYMDFDPDNFGIRMKQGGAVRLVYPAMVSVICFNPEKRIAAMLLHLNNANSVISVCDTAAGRQVYTDLVETPPHVPGRRMEFMAIDHIDLVPVLSEDATTVAYGVYSYLYKNSVYILDIASGKISKIKNAAIPFLWKDRAYYLDMVNPMGKKILMSAMLDGSNRKKFAAIDFEPSLFMMQEGVLYAVSGTKTYALRIGTDKKFVEIADASDLFAGLDAPSLARIFPVEHDAKEFMIFVIKNTENGRENFSFYSKQL
jgi:hypothetical protein